MSKRMIFYVCASIFAICIGIFAYSELGDPDEAGCVRGWFAAFMAGLTVGVLTYHFGSKQPPGKP
jgi:hypothetical protein